MTHHTELPIIVVQDDLNDLSLIASLLRAHDFHNIVTFEDSRLALDFLIESEAAAVVLDLAMPDVTGQDLLHYLRSEKPHIPAVVVTAERQIETAVDCMKTGAVDYLTKPIHVDKLIDSLTHALEIGRGGEHKLAAGAQPSAPQSIIPEGTPERFGKAAIYMKQHLSQDLYLESVAQQACMSKYHFAREFKRYFGVSPMQFMLRLRIAHATAMLLAQEAPISRIASECGFSDQSEFTKWFKKSTGVTPSKFRKSLSFGSNGSRASHAARGGRL